MKIDIASGRFWLRIWLGAFAGTVVWAVFTIAFWMDSTRNVNALSIVALLLTAAAGIQATLAMRKADRDDPL